MAKRIHPNFAIYIAPDILGFYIENIPEAFDEKKQMILNPNLINDKILIYERQVKGWFLNNATRMIKSKGNGFIVLMICMSYLEGIQQYIQGESSRNRSGTFFKNSIHRIYPNAYSDSDLDNLYSAARCGLFHNGMVDGRIIINTSYLHPIEFIGTDDIRINPKHLLIDIKNDFNDYLKSLRNPSNTIRRQNFDSMFSNI
ncbi:hypothetical protein [Mucilaginibacter psychrotolerans]|uniref:Uncharacterized protein n=1 Tax=Mucilaginibacter psychrotolerans TaxID=1524096 RepID=A0A4Y8S5M8_9SPHI|nr:hypothetical protein [Mucilaginibacter psychrotolerans]TFF34036.1 hypothetical protein E2R66_23365 [Mucilaginibacter psychrotolerans]